MILSFGLDRQTFSRLVLVGIISTFITVPTLGLTESIAQAAPATTCVGPSNYASCGLEYDNAVYSMSPGIQTGSDGGVATFTFQTWLNLSNYSPTHLVQVFIANQSGGLQFYQNGGQWQLDSRFIDNRKFTCPSYPANDWFSIVVEQTKTFSAMWLNGQRCGSTQSPLNISTSARTTMIGGSPDYADTGVQMSDLRFGTTGEYDPTQSTITPDSFPLSARSDTVLLMNSSNPGNFTDGTGLQTLSIQSLTGGTIVGTNSNPTITPGAVVKLDASSLAGVTNPTTWPDLSGNGSNASLTQGYGSFDSTNQALDFSAAPGNLSPEGGSYPLVTGFNTTQMTGFSASFYARIPALANTYWQRIFDAASTPNVDNNPHDSIFIGRFGTSSKLRFAFSNLNGCDVDFQPDTWAHYAVTLASDGSCVWYVNGAIVSSSAGTTGTPYAANRSSLFIGRSHWNDYLFKGEIANLSLYNFKLTDAQVAANYLAQGPGRLQSSTTTTISVSAGTAIYGANFSLAAQVSPSAATGTVTFLNNGVEIPSCKNIAISSGSATCSAWHPSVGNYTSLAVKYSGDSSYASSTSTTPAAIQITSATLTVQPLATSVVYGGTPTYLYSITGYVNGDGSSVVSGSPLCSSSYSTTTSVGTPLSFSCTTGTLLATNYTFSSSGTAALTITQATPTLSLALNAATPVYGSVDTITATASVAGTVTFKKAGVAISGCATVQTTSSAPYAAQCSWVPDAASTNYSLTATLAPADSTNYSSPTSSALTPTSTKASITITPTSGQSKIYGTQDPTLSYTITSGALVGSDQLSGALTYASAGQNTAVGNYAISLGTLTSANNPNYLVSLSSSPVTFAITQASQAAVSLSSLSAPYNAANKSVTLTGSGGSGTGTTFTYALVSAGSTPGCGIQTNSNILTYQTAGTCIVAVTRSGDSNYLPRTDSVSFSIGLASQSISFSGISTQTYSSTPFIASATATSGLAVTFTSASPSVCTSSGSNGASITFLNVGTCVINANQAGDTSTAQAPTVTQSFTVSPAPITITADAKSKLYAAPDPTLTYSVTSGSLLTGDSLTGSLSRAPGSDAGQYPITVGTLNSPKYAITFIPANLIILQIAPTLNLTYPNNNLVILTPGVFDTPTVKSSSSNGTLTFTIPTTSSVCTVDPVTGVLSLLSAGTCQVVMTSAATTNYLQGIDTETVTAVLQSSSLAGIPSGNLIPMGGTFYASPVLTQTITATSGSNGASVSIPANALPATTAISVNLLTDASSQLALISGASSSVLSVVVSWVSPDGSVPQTAPGLAISVTLTNPAIKSGAKVYSVFGGVSTLVGTATIDGSVTSQITSDPVLVVVNPVVVATPLSSGGGGGGGYVAPVPTPPTASPADNSAAIAAAKALADQQAADKAAQDAADAAALKAAQEKMAADAKALADALANSKAAADAATLKAAQDAADASAKAAAALQAAKDAADAAAKAALSAKPVITLYSITAKLTLSTYDSAYLQRYVQSLKNGASVTCVGYIYQHGTTLAKATALAKSQANAVCSLMKKSNKTLKTAISLVDAKQAPKAAKGAKWVAVSYRVDGFKPKS